MIVWCIGKDRIARGLSKVVVGCQGSLGRYGQCKRFRTMVGERAIGAAAAESIGRGDFFQGQLVSGYCGGVFASKVVLGEAGGRQGRVVYLSMFLKLLTSNF